MSSDTFELLQFAEESIDKNDNKIREIRYGGTYGQKGELLTQAKTWC